MLEALVIAGLIAAPLGSAALFLPGRHRYRPGPLAATWRVIVAVVGSARRVKASVPRRSLIARASSVAALASRVRKRAASRSHRS